jgi:hypothetical protein
MFAHLLATIDISANRIWAVQAAGFATAGLVLMIGRFINNWQRKRALASQSRPPSTIYRVKLPEPHAKPIGYHLPTDLSFKVEDAWR